MMTAKSTCMGLTVLAWMGILLIMGSPPLYGQAFDSLSGEGVTVLYQGPLKGSAEEAATLFPGIRNSLEQALGLRVSFHTTVVLVDDPAAFQKATGSPFLVAYAIPGRNLMVIDSSKMRMHPFSLETTMKHELCHLLLHHHIGEENLPRWLDEGISQWASDGIGEIMMDIKRSLLDKAILTGDIIALRSLTIGFPADKKSLFLAYEQSKSLVEYMISRFGLNGFKGFLRRLSAGETLDGALMSGFALSLPELEKAWQQHLRKRINWFTHFSVHLYEVLFFAAALLVVYGFVRLGIKKRAYLRESEDATATDEQE